MHLDEEKVERLVHGEMHDATAQAAEAHIAVCESCRRRVNEVRQGDELVFSLLRHIDTPAPAIPVSSVLRKAAARTAPAPRLVLADVRRRKFDWRWAAALLIAASIAGAAGYLVPGSPMPGIVKAALKMIAAPSPDPAPVPAAAGTTTSFGGIQAVPGRSFTIAFARASQGSEARLVLTDGAQVEIRSLEGEVRFSVPGDSLVSIENTGAPGPRRFEILIPRSAPRVDLVVAGRRVFRKEGSTITTSVAADERGRYTIPFVPPPS